MVLVLSSCGVGAVINLSAMKTYVSFFPKKSFTCKRSKIVAGNRGIKATASASTLVATEPLTKEDLIAYFSSGCKTKDMWRIGTKHEKNGFDVKTLRPMSPEQITALLNGISERFGWDKVMETGRIVGLKQGMHSISLEPGGQLELSGAPLETFDIA